MCVSAQGGSLDAAADPNPGRERERETAILAQVGGRWGVNLDCDSRGAFLPFAAVFEHHVRSCVCLNGPRVLSLCPTPDHDLFGGGCQ